MLAYYAVVLITTVKRFILCVISDPSETQPIEIPKKHGLKRLKFSSPSNSIYKSFYGLADTSVSMPRKQGLGVPTSLVLGTFHF